MYSVCLCLVASASSLTTSLFGLKKKRKKERSKNLVASLLLHLSLLLEIAGAAILLDNLHGGVVLEVAHRGALPLAVGHQRDCAVPRGCEAGLGVEESHGQLVLTSGLVDGETQVVGEGVLDGSSKGL